MDPAILSAAAALVGSLIGATSAVATTLLTQRGQARNLARSQELTKREALYADFIAEAALRLAEGIGQDTQSLQTVVALHAAIGRMRLMSSREVVSAAERLVRLIIQTYAAPNRTFAEFRDNLLHGQANQDPLKEFGEACRAELLALRNLV